MTVDMAKLLDASEEIGSFPAIVHRINAAIDNPKNSLDTIGDIINEDPGLSARLMRIANSSFYNFPFPVNTISRALTVVGTKQLKDMIYSTYVVDIFYKIPNNMVDFQAFWYHSIACGVMSRALATAIRTANVERYYLSGLLHDIGHLILFSQLPKQAMHHYEQSKSASPLIHTAEEQDLGFNHADLGGALLERWGLPPDIHLPVRHHHQPQRAAQYYLETAILHVAEIMAIVHLGEIGLESHIPPLDPAAWDEINLPVSAIPNIMDHAKVQFNDAIQMFLKTG